MVTHIVLWKLKPEAEGKDAKANAAIIKAGLEALVGVVPGMLSSTVGLNFAVGESYDLALVSTFTDREALAGYQIHPAHDKVRQYVRKVIESRTMCDFE